MINSQHTIMIQELTHKNIMDFDRNKIAALFLFSGIATLAYQIVWIRQFTYIFGASLFAVSTVVAAFMGGLSLGSRLGAYFAGRLQNHLRFFGLLEITIAISAMSLLVLFSDFELFKLAFLQFNNSFFVNAFIQFLAIFVLLLAPATMMGMTLPVLSHHFARYRDIGVEVGKLYAANTAGAVLGCFAASFYGLPLIGLAGTVYVAIFINLAVGTTAIWLSFKESATQYSEKIILQKKTSRPVVIFLLLYMFSGMIFLGYQMLWTRSLIFTFGLSSNTTYTYAAMLIVFLLGISIGSLLISKLGRWIKNPLRIFSFVQLLAGIVAVFSLLLTTSALPYFNPFYYVNLLTGEVYWLANLANIFLKSMIAVLPTTILMGMSFPLMVKSCHSDAGSIAHTVGKVYFFNTLGAACGVFITAFILIPILGITKTFLLFLLICAFISAATFFLDPENPFKLRIAYLAFIVFIAVTAVAVYPKNYVFHIYRGGEDGIVYYKEGPLDTVSVIRYAQGHLRLAIDGVEIGGTDPAMLTDQKMLAHLPMLLVKNPKRALSIGFGTGGTSWSFLRYKELKKLDVVEISPTVIEAAAYLKDSNHEILKQKDNRLNIVIDDARNYLRAGSRKYDIIGIDCTDLRYKSNASLYSLDFFELVRKRLSEDGMAVAWLPLGKLSDESFRTALRTFNRVFPNTYVWYFNNYPAHYVLLVGKVSPIQIDYQSMLDKFNRPEVRKDLSSININDPLKILSSFVTDGNYLKRELNGKLLNTDDFPYLEFYAPKFRFSSGDRHTLDNLQMLLKGRMQIYPYLANIENKEQKKLKRQLKNYETAVPLLVAGHDLVFKGDYRDAYFAYKKALEANPADTSILQLLSDISTYLR